MYVLQMADLHIGSEDKCLEDEQTILFKGIDKIKQEIPKEQKLLVCVCGDIIDSKDSAKWKKGVAGERYEEAAQLFRLMQQELGNDYEVIFKFCLGNHDVTHIDEFMKFSTEFDSQISKVEIESGYYLECEGIYYVFLNSCYGNQYKYGCLDFDKVEKMLKKIPDDHPKIFVLHHTIMSMYDNDMSAIRNSARLLEIINTYGVIGMLHGHIHGRERFFIGEKQCKIIGVGALFSRNNPNVNSQFNIIELTPFELRHISTYLYYADNRISGEPWSKLETDKENNENYFFGTTFEDVYIKLIDKLEYEGVLNNVTLQIDCTYEEFTKNLENYLSNDKLVMGEKQFSYFQLAEMWESTEVPKELYFNHGMYFKVMTEECREEHGINLIERQLKSKHTSNKAVLTTYGMDTVTKMLKGEEYLPSLLSVQFSQSYDGNVMYVHMYLRALEAGRFLKINICEIKWLLEHLKALNVLFNQVDVAISAFRVQKRERFSCFLKADIDNMDEFELARYVAEGNVSKICQLLQEKRDALETITNMRGIQLFRKALRVFDNSAIFPTYSSVIIEKLDKVLEIYVKLDGMHQRGSIKTDEEENYEREIIKRIDEIICELKEISEV